MAAVLTCRFASGKVVDIDAQAFKYFDYKGAEVSGNKYYVDKAVSLGAHKKQPKRKAKIK